MVTIPTIDQFSGTTVMNKVRQLISTFIDFANDMDTEITVNIPNYIQSVIPEYIEEALESYYTKTEVDTLLTSYYTKTEVDTILNGYVTSQAFIGTLTMYYTKTAVDNLLVNYYNKTEVDSLLDDKQDVLTAGDNITIVDNVISATSGGISEDWEEVTGSWADCISGNNLKYDVILSFPGITDGGISLIYYLPKGLDIYNLYFSKMRIHDTSYDELYIISIKARDIFGSSTSVSGAKFVYGLVPKSGSSYYDLTMGQDGNENTIKGITVKLYRRV